MKLLYHADLRPGTALQRERALQRRDDMILVESPIGSRQLGLAARIAMRLGRVLRLPLDPFGENRQLLRLAREHRPDAVFVYNSRAITGRTLRQIRRETGAVTAYFDTDDAVAPHNLTPAVLSAFPEWDLFFTTKTFNLEDLPRFGVRKPCLSLNFYDPEEHRPLTPAEVGPEFEKFDLVFVGTFEADRAESLVRLAEAGFSVLVQGNAAGIFTGGWERVAQAGVTVRPAAEGVDYAPAIHRGKVALGFLRKLHRDQITSRSIELPAMGRAMLAEKTDEHDAHLVDGVEYVGFRTPDEMIAQARALLADAERRAAIGAAARARCERSPYSVDAVMAQVVEELRTAISPKRRAEARD